MRISQLYKKHAFMLKPMVSEIKNRIKKGDTAVDMGCGTGIYLNLLHKQVGKKGKIIAIDKSTDMVAYCRMKFRKQNITIRKLPAEKISMIKEPVDVVFASLVLQFTRINKAISSISKILKPKGLLIFAVPLYRTGITIGIDKASNEFKKELERNIKVELEKRDIGKKASLDYPNSRNKAFKEALRKGKFRVLRWSILPLEKNNLKFLLDYYKIPWRSKNILKIPFKKRFSILAAALKRTFEMHPKFIVKRHYLVAAVRKK